MRKLKLQVQISLDGFMANLDGKTDWMVWSWGPDWNWGNDLQAYFNSLKSKVDCVLLSRKMAEEGFIDHWAKIAENQNDPQFNFAKKITGAQKVVFTHTQAKSFWPHTLLAKGELGKEVNALKKQKGQDIIVYGGVSFVSSLIKANLIDEYYLFVNPIVIGTGLPLFQDIDIRFNLKLVEARSFDMGMVVLHYSKK